MLVKIHQMIVIISPSIEYSPKKTTTTANLSASLSLHFIPLARKLENFKKKNDHQHKETEKNSLNSTNTKVKITFFI